jgi:hypothetical protein
MSFLDRRYGDKSLLPLGLAALIESIQTGEMPGPWQEGKPLSHAPVLGVGGSVGKALAWALTKEYYFQRARAMKFNARQPPDKQWLLPDLGGGQGMTLRQKPPSQGFWVVNCEGWTYHPPRKLSQLATKRLQSQTPYPQAVCKAAIQLAFSAGNEAWRAAVEEHYAMPPAPLTQDEIVRLFAQALHAAGERRKLNQAYMPNDSDFSLPEEADWQPGPRAQCWACHPSSGEHDLRKSWMTRAVTPKHPMCRECVDNFLALGQ